MMFLIHKAVILGEAACSANKSGDQGLGTCQQSAPHIALIKSPKACQEGTF